MEVVTSSIIEFKRLLYADKRIGSGFMQVAIACESVLLADKEVGYGGEKKDEEEVATDLKRVNEIILSVDEDTNTHLAVLEEAYYRNVRTLPNQEFDIVTNTNSGKTWTMVKLHSTIWKAMRELNKIVMKVAVKYKVEIPYYNPEHNQYKDVKF